MKKFIVIAALAALFIGAAAAVIPGPVKLTDLPLSRQLNVVIPFTNNTDISNKAGFAGGQNMGSGIYTQYVEFATTNFALAITVVSPFPGPASYQTLVVEMDNRIIRVLTANMGEDLKTPIVIPPNSTVRFHRTEGGSTALGLAGYLIDPSEF